MGTEDHSGDFVAGFFLGALVGAAAAVLFTPVPGAELRRQIRERGIACKAFSGDKGMCADSVSSAIASRGYALLDQGRARLHEIIEEGRRAAARKREELVAELESAQTAARARTSAPPDIELT